MMALAAFNLLSSGTLVLTAGLCVMLWRSEIGRLLRSAPSRPWRRRAWAGPIWALGATAIFLTVGVSTIRTAYQSQSVLEKARATIPLATKPPPPLADEPGPSEEFRARYLLSVIIRGNGREDGPARVQTFEINWPDDAGKRFELDETTFGPFEVDYAFEPAELKFPEQITESYISKDGDEPYLFGSLHYDVRWRWLFMSARSGSSPLPRYLRPGPVGHGSVGDGATNSALSLASLNPYHGCDLSVLLQRVAEDDPLHETDVLEYLASRGRLPGTATIIYTNAMTPSVNAPSGLLLLIHTGRGGLLLIVAAALAAQYFRRRSLAFAATVLVAVIYMAALDRAVLSIHASHLNRSDVTPTQRIVTSELIRQSFFYRHSASHR